MTPKSLLRGCAIAMYFLAVWGLCSSSAPVRAQTQVTQATTVPLLLPGGLAYDAAGDLYFAETGNHVIRRLSPAGLLTIVAGTGVQGFGGDGGLAVVAWLDSPVDVAVDLAGDLYIADSHNHRIRRVDAVSGVITTVGVVVDLPSALAVDVAGNVYFADAMRHMIRRMDGVSGTVSTVAGNGVQGYSGDGGLAVAASIDSPWGIAVDVLGNVWFSDSHNQRIRRIDGVSGVISTVVGFGSAGFGGDLQVAQLARVSLPRGLVLDGGGNLFVVDSGNQRIRRVDAVSGVITTVVGDGIQGFAGDLGVAVAAEVNAPRNVAVSNAGFPVVSDSGNGRVRMVDASTNIHTAAGLGMVATGNLSLKGTTIAFYGSGSVTATLATTLATGSVVFFDQGTTLGTAALTSNVATFSTASLAAGVHQLSATYVGDATHAAAQSGMLAITIAPVQVTGSPVGVSVVYGQAVPALTGMLAGVLLQDAGNVMLGLSSGAGVLSAPGTYGISGVLGGSAAGDYALTVLPAAVVIGKAASGVTLASGLGVHVAPAYTGVPTGSVTLLDGSLPYATGALSGTGDVVFSSSGLSAGTHTLTASYPGDLDFLGASSAPLVVTIGTAVLGDFALASVGATPVTVTGGSAAVFSFGMTALNGGLSSPIQLSVVGLPVGATGSFSPAYLVPGSAAQAFTLTVQTTKLAGLGWREGLVFAGLIPVLMVARRRRGLVVLGMLAGFVLGCGDRVNAGGAASAGAATYNLTVTGVGTGVGGVTMLHSVGVTLTVD